MRRVRVKVKHNMKLFSKVSANRQLILTRNTLRGLANLVSATYRLYMRQKPRWGSFTPNRTLAAHRTILEANYNNPMMEDIKSEIRQNGKDSGDCPFCGFGEITDVDHFLPSSSYPEYSIYTNNLIPSCHRCNNLKNNSGLVNFHPYFDNVINSEFLVCNLTNKRQTVLFSGRFSIDYSLLTTTESSLVNDVYGKLDLIERFESVVTNHVEGIRTDYDKIRNFVTIQIFLQSHYDSKLQLHGPNHYKTATAKSLLNNVSLLSTIW